MTHILRPQYIFLLFATAMACSPLLRAQDAAGGYALQSRLILDEVLEQDAQGQDAVVPVLLPEGSGDRKSGFLGVLFSALLPGMGELYAGRFDRGKYPLIVEGALWVGLIGINAYGNWTETDARSFAAVHAGVNGAGKDDDYFVNIENYRDLYEYNNQRLAERRLNDVYPDSPEYYWEWDSEANRTSYKDQRIKADELHNGVTFFALGLVANRIWSAIQAAVLVGDHNSSLEASQSLLPDLQTTVTSYAGRADGMNFRFRFTF
jgi:hypothetical protein